MGVYAELGEVSAVLNRVMSPTAHGGGVLGRGLAAAERAVKGSPGGAGEQAPQGALGKALHGFGAAVDWMTSLEKRISAPFAAVPFPGLPAATVFMPVFGFPHAHGHWPNLTPPNPVPITLPSLGMILPIKYLSGASKTMISGLKAARCGDLGGGLWCGGYFPMFEIFLGSASVWIEGARAARFPTDVTKHCVFSAPRPTDPPLGPMFGAILMGNPRVLIGGVPMPSLTSLAIGEIFRGLFKGLGRLYRLTRLDRLVDKIITPMAERFVDEIFARGNITLHGDEAFCAAARRDLVELAKTRAGKRLLAELADEGRPLRIMDLELAHNSGLAEMSRGPVCRPQSMDAYVRFTPDPNGEAQVVCHYDPVRRRWYHDYDRGPRVTVDGPGAGSGSDIYYDPMARTPRHSATPASPSDVILGHEMNHARNNARGYGAGLLGSPGGEDHFSNSKFQDWEEHNTVRVENQVRKGRGDVPERSDYGSLP